MSMNIAARAKNVARIFDAIAWIVLVIGGLTMAVTLLAGLFGALNDGYFGSLLLGIVFAALAGVYTAILWASITLSTIIAGYIANRSEAPSGV